MAKILEQFKVECHTWHKYRKEHCYPARQIAYGALIKELGGDAVLRHVHLIAHILDKAEEEGN